MKGDYIELDEQLEDILISAVRYALGRKTNIVSTTVSVMLPIISKLSMRALIVLLRDIEKAPDYGDDKIDKPYWMLMGQRIERELSERRG